MLLPHGHHLAYSTNIHPGETWPETLHALDQYTLAVRASVCPGRPFGIGLRLSDTASRELSEPSTLLHFRRWLERHDCYVFTMNGFPFGRFHGARVKERVYLPDWTSHERLDYTNRLFDLLVELLPDGVSGSVSTLPGSFKEFIHGSTQLAAINGHLFECVKHIEELSGRTGKTLHLGLEPEPLGLLETSQETVDFFNRLREEHPNEPGIEQFLGVNYDTCHLAVEFEEASEVLARLRDHRIKISKIHLSNALKGTGNPADLAQFADDTYLHQVIVRHPNGELTRYKDLDLFLNPHRHHRSGDEFRVHFHIPLHTPPTKQFGTTSDHLLETLNVLKASPELCSHLEMETYTWNVLPPELKSRSVVDQLVAEYEWSLEELRTRGLAE
jgi:hypothetical protein